MLTTAGHSGCAAAQCTASMPPSDRPTTNGLSRPSVSRAATAPEKVHGVKPPLRPCPGRSAAITVKSSVSGSATSFQSPRSEERRVGKECRRGGGGQLLQNNDKETGTEPGRDE